MKRRNTYYVQYKFSYEYFDTQENAWIPSTDFDYRIVSDTLKRDIPKKVKDDVLYDMRNDEIRGFKFEITEIYQTSDDACE